MNRAMSVPPTGCRLNCWGCGIPVYSDVISHDCYLCNDCWVFYRPFECYYDSRGRLWGWIWG